MTKEDQSFEVNFKKLEKLSVELQENKISIDALVPKMKEALESIKICKEVLKQTKIQLKEINSEFTDLSKQEE